ncbi:hypothetical protein [Erythrobacter sp. QSSC1-22B]|uniref:hypothetical protein n=1 Tax=Erythrobacter sp. QSSC1-22B TaxID=1860125 RepID=UPI0011AABE46|nr:hypothetical protein [Erythrobacter sp. QSSC1-22B]
MSDKPVSLQRAAISGLLFAVVMCTWRYFDDGDSFDQLAIRFAIYFSAFTLGFWLLYNLVTKRRADS